MRAEVEDKTPAILQAQSRPLNVQDIPGMLKNQHQIESDLAKQGVITSSWYKFVCT